MKKILMIAFAAPFLFTSCAKEELVTNPADAVSSTEKAPPQNGVYDFTFNSGFQGWIAGFSDYPVGGEMQYKLGADHVKIPENIVPGNKCVELTGFNNSDDLFMFIKRKVEGLQPNTTYDVAFNLEMVSEYPLESIGIGGSPGASVFTKVGAVNYEPLSISPSGVDYQMNIDKGNQSVGGADMLMIGDIGIPGANFDYTIIHRDNSTQAFQVTTDGNGDVWVIVGTDSGFEGITSIYYNEINVTFTAL